MTILVISDLGGLVDWIFSNRKIFEMSHRRQNRYNHCRIEPCSCVIFVSIGFTCRCVSI